MINLMLPNIPPVVAYIDAGTGTLILQILIAGAVAGLFFIRGFWKKIRNLFKRKND